MRSHRIVPWLGSLGVVGLLLAQRTTQPPETIFGVYGQFSPGRNSIRVIKRANGGIGLAVKLYYSNGHTCQLDADGEWLDGHLTVMAEGLNPDQSCSLNAYFSRNRISLKDPGLRCAPVYCGTRGKLDDVTLSKSSADRK